MKILQLHVNSIEFEPIKKEIEVAEEIEKNKYKFENLLVLFTCIENEDKDETVKIAVEEVLKSLDELKLSKVLIYPYAHLSRNLAPPSKSLEIIKSFEKYLREKNIETYRAPFGWTKRLSLDIKGHPLAEQFKDISTKGKLEEHKKIEKKYYVFTKEGKLVDVKDYNLKNAEKDLRILIEQEAFGKSSSIQKEPKFIKLMNRFGIDWESFSDLGHMRYNYLGSFIIDMVSDYISKIVRELPLPVYFVRGTNMFDLKKKPIEEHASLFGQRMYKVEYENKMFVLRYAACFQQFCIAKDMNISYRNLPFGMFEIADSYRFEQSGELLLSFRLRKLLMPDLHVFCKDIEEAKKVFLMIHDKIHSEIEKIGRKYVSLYNITSKEFFEENIEFFKELVKRENYDVLICEYPKNSNYYWVLNIEYHIIDELGRAREIGTVQIDIGNAERFGIKYVDKDGKEKYPVILHTAIIGSIERFIYTIFDNIATGKYNCLPLWLSPIQVRIIPVSEKFLDNAIEIAKKIKARVDVDDRNLTVQKKIREAEISMINYIVVVGEKEIKNNRLSVREKGSGIREMSIEELNDEIVKKISGYPFREISLPLELSRRPL